MVYGCDFTTPVVTPSQIMALVTTFMGQFTSALVVLD